MYAAIARNYIAQRRLGMYKEMNSRAGLDMEGQLIRLGRTDGYAFIRCWAHLERASVVLMFPLPQRKVRILPLYSHDLAFRLVASTGLHALNDRNEK